MLALSFSHMLNDTIQSLMPALYPFLKDGFHLSYTQIGLITLTFQLTARSRPSYRGWTPARETLDRSPAACLAASSR